MVILFRRIDNHHVCIFLTCLFCSVTDTSETRALLKINFQNSLDNTHFIYRRFRESENDQHRNTYSQILISLGGSIIRFADDRMGTYLLVAAHCISRRNGPGLVSRIDWHSKMIISIQTCHSLSGKNACQSGCQRQS